MEPKVNTLLYKVISIVTNKVDQVHQVFTFIFTIYLMLPWSLSLDI